MFKLKDNFYKHPKTYPEVVKMKKLNERNQIFMANHFGAINVRFVIERLIRSISEIIKSKFCCSDF